MPVCNLSEWETFLKSYPNAHFMQSAAWGALKADFAWKTVRLADSQGGAQILFRKLPLGLSIAYIPRGPLGNPGQDFWKEVDQICRQEHTIFLKVELDEWQAVASDLTFPAGFQPSPHSIQPASTILVDLSPTEDGILQKMRQKTRYNIHLAERDQVTVTTWDDIPAFHQMLTITGNRDGFGVHSLAYYQRAYHLFQDNNSAELLAAFYQGQPLAALMVFARGQRAWYVYGASSDQERKRMPTYLLQWQAMRWAKQRGCLNYDLWGIPDASEQELEEKFTERSTGLWGVYRFKRGFGGRVMRSMTAMDKVYLPALYKFYQWRMAGRETGA